MSMKTTTGKAVATETLDEMKPVHELGHRNQSICLNDIRLRAYQNWQAAGKPRGDCSCFWMQAEQELLQGK